MHKTYHFFKILNFVIMIINKTFLIYSIFIRVYKRFYLMHFRVFAKNRSEKVQLMTKNIHLLDKSFLQWIFYALISYL